MARAPETGFYFEPLSERLALVLEGTPFPSDDHWAYVGDPVEITADLAKLECANRWPGVDPDALMVELPTNFEQMVTDIERLQLLEAERAAAEIPDFDIDTLLQQAETLREMAAQMKAPGAADLERSEERR